MNSKWFLIEVLIYFLSDLCNAQRRVTQDDLEHDPYWYRPSISPKIEGSSYEIPGINLTPDYREPEPPNYPFKEEFYKEENRPYRISPHFLQMSRWKDARKEDNPDLFGCYCTTVFKRFVPLAGCAVITTRHLITTASSTELIIKDRRDKILENILGAWYDNNANTLNSSMYMTPARIHYHPKFIRPENVNISHPIPGYFDLAVWAATYPFYGNFWTWSKTCICQRGSSHRFHYAPSTPHGELLIIIGFQWIMAWKRKPMPWYKYAIRTRDTINPCPKVEWGWYHCVPANWAKFGIEPGAALHRAFEGKGWRYDGLIAINSFSMRLRSDSLIHYFHPLDTHKVLDFLYSAYMGRLPYDYLDYRFYNTQWKAPRPKSWWYIPWNYQFGSEPNVNPIPWY